MSDESSHEGSLLRNQLRQLLDTLPDEVVVDLIEKAKGFQLLLATKEQYSSINDIGRHPEPAYGSFDLWLLLEDAKDPAAVDKRKAIQDEYLRCGGILYMLTPYVRKSLSHREIVKLHRLDTSSSLRDITDLKHYLVLYKQVIFIQSYLLADITNHKREYSAEQLSALRI